MTAIKGQVLADFMAEFTESLTRPTGGHEETTVAPAGQQTAPIGGGKRIHI